VHTANIDAATEAKAVLELLTPIVKSWPSEWCLEANSLAIQVLGGYGYTRDFPVEQYWRDNRLNMIHEGTHGIQALDLLGRKVLADNGAGMRALAQRVAETVRAASTVSELASSAESLLAAAQKLERTTRAAWANGADAALANATPYLQAFGHVVVAWLWLDVNLNTSEPGRRAALRYFYDYELAKIDAWLAPVAARNSLFRDMQDQWF
jgi:butyryl-CoA dehydrogenase